MTRREQPMWKPTDPPSARKLNKLGSEVGRLGSLQTANTGDIVYDNAAGRFVMKRPPAGDKIRRFRITESITDGDTESAIAIYRTSHPQGITAARLNASDTVAAEDETIYADYIRGVFCTSDIVICRLLNGKWQIDDDGTLQWQATAVDDLDPDGTVQLDHRDQNVEVEAELIGPLLSVTTGTTVYVWWLDAAQEFKAQVGSCPDYDVAEV